MSALLGCVFSSELLLKWKLQVLLRSALAASIIASSVSVARSDDRCPKDLENYGIFLQAKKVCGREVEYPFMNVVRDCAKRIPKDQGIALMNDGRRTWAKSVMRSSVGTMCEKLLSQLPAMPHSRER